MNNPSQLSFLYRFELGNGLTYLYTNASERQIVDGENYEPIEIDHSTPTYSATPDDAEVDVTVNEKIPVSNYFILSPPPFQIIVKILEYNVQTGSIENDDYYKGWIIRPSFDLDDNVVAFHCKTLWHYFERETLVDSLAALSRYSIFDPRSGADVETLRVTVTVTAFNDQRDVLTVTGLTDPDGWYTGGVIQAPDGDERTIILDETVGPNRQLTLSGAFDEQTLAVGFSADVFPGDDLTYETWSTKFDAQTSNGGNHGGWPYMPNVDPVKRGVI